jgi:subtilisin family serine protease
VREQDAMVRVSAPAARARATGRGQLVAVLDGGFYLRHEFLAGRLAPGYDALSDTADPQDLSTGDILGHGTFVASLVLAAAPNATILPVRVLDNAGWGSDAAVAAGIAFAAQSGASVVNLSLVLPSATQIVRDAVRVAEAAGVVIVMSGGTTDDHLTDDPYIAGRALVVGATDASDVIAPWCLGGIQVQLYAPGVQICGALGGRAPNAYGLWSGNSFAAPFVSAGAAMIREKHPSDWSASAVRARLTALSDPVYFAPNRRLPNRGRVDLGQAVPAN